MNHIVSSVIKENQTIITTNVYVLFLREFLKCNPCPFRTVRATVRLYTDNCNTTFIKGMGSNGQNQATGRCTLNYDCYVTEKVICTLSEISILSKK